VIETYTHHGVEVKVDSELKGKHRQHCLCHQCGRLDDKLFGKCFIATKLYQICVEYNVTTPVYECPHFIEPEALARERAETRMAA
jgi:hypothetical protein